MDQDWLLAQVFIPSIGTLLRRVDDRLQLVRKDEDWARGEGRHLKGKFVALICMMMMMMMGKISNKTEPNGGFRTSRFFPSSQ